MKKIVLNIICIFFVCYYCSGQGDYIFIRHIGVSDRYIPKILIIKEDINHTAFKSDSAYFKRLYVDTFHLNNYEFEFLKTFAYKKELLDNEFKNSWAGSLEITFVIGGKKEIFFSASPKSQIYIKNIITGIEKNVKNEKLLFNLDKMLKLIS